MTYHIFYKKICFLHYLVVYNKKVINFDNIILFCIGDLILFYKIYKEYLYHLNLKNKELKKFEKILQIKTFNLIFKDQNF